MNKNLLIGITAVLLIGGAGLMLFKGSIAPSPKTPSDETLKTPEPSPQQKSLKDLLGLSASQECSFSDDKGNRGQVLTSGGKMKGDFTVEAGGKQIKSHMIIDGENAYVWMEGQENGFKMPLKNLSATAEADLKNNNQAPKEVDINKKVNYTCKGWVANSAAFTPPSEVKFSDLGTLFAPKGNQTSGTNQTGTSQQCAACDNLSGEAKLQCKTALKCS